MRSALRPALLTSLLALAACDTGGLSESRTGPFAPGVDHSEEAVDGLVVGDRLMDAGEHELALKAYIRAAGDHGMTPDVLISLGSANLALGRLGQAESFLKRALEKDETRPDAWNNLGVILLEKGEVAQSVQVFRKAYALDNGDSDMIRDNLRLALAKLENPSYDDEQANEYKMVRRGRSSYLIRQTP
ncbi:MULTISPECIES: tetratricopeptide repeat protein [Shimia]|uniref:tetratricopeptide repeat protein n=1 Tax=Shimia TaxID=573139 RepID=UPI001FB55C46|nr:MULTISPECIES: tetratricopeptide repeat protein [Shimia]MDV4145952.1 tetratricopeptide repeat protein [Shimia sp. FJ5]